jgi:hypothetical protein
MWIRHGFVCKLFLVGPRLASFLLADPKLYSLSVHNLFDCPDGNLGQGQASTIQERVQGQLPQEQKSNVPFPLLIDDTKNIS